MKVYIVRHGETVANRKHIHQLPSSQLSPLGERQALLLGTYFKDKNIDYLISSDFDRAVSTAEPIAGSTGAPLVQSAMFRELRRPKSLMGKSHFGIDTLSYGLTMLWNHREQGWHYKDGESFSELVDRAKDARNKLVALSDHYENVVVVTHAFFSEILTAFMCHESEPSLHEFLPIVSPFSVVPNASVTVVQYHNSRESNVCEWQLVSENQVGHLRT